MPYIYGTHLSYDNGYECATVIDDTEVMVTKSMGVECRIPLNINDWLSYARTPVVEDFIPCRDEVVDDDERFQYSDSSAESNESEYNAHSEHEAHWLESEQFPIGTKIRWDCDPHYRMAVITKNGALQVKWSYPGPIHGMSVEDNRKIFFKNIADWYKSLPKNGEISVIPYECSIKKKTAFLSSDMSDVDKLKELTRVFKVRSFHLGGESPSDLLEIFKKAMEKQYNVVSRISLLHDIENPKIRESETKLLNIYVNRYTNYRRSTAMMPPERFLKREPISVIIRSPARISASVNRKWKSIMVHGDKIVVQGLPFADNFQDAGIDFIDGKPKLSIFYRKKLFDLF